MVVPGNRTSDVRASLGASGQIISLISRKGLAFPDLLKITRLLDINSGWIFIFLFRNDVVFDERLSPVVSSSSNSP
jgi:hypothetical protein